MNVEVEFLDFKQIKQAVDSMGENVFFVSDSNVVSIVNFNEFVNFNEDKSYIMPAGEDNKTLETAAQICIKMLNAGADRNTVLIAVGGGVVGDTAGFAASIYMRGIKWINVPTTLLAQVDSSIGGKTGVDLQNYKNIVGSFWLAEKTLINTDFLNSLSEREWLCGLGEVVKTAMLSQEIFDFMQINYIKLIDRNKDVTKKAVKLCAHFKLSVTAIDFKESSLRKKLNLGHTAGHALEYTDNHVRSHGEYVLWGLLIESFMFKSTIQQEFYHHAQKMIKAILQAKNFSFDVETVARAAIADKKNSRGKISVITAINPNETVENFMTQDEFCFALSDWQKQSEWK